MALPILDGNQTATTLSTILTGGAHIPAHTVVSLGSQAITDVRSAVSGSVISISNFPSTQTIAGTVTANVFGSGYLDQPYAVPVMIDGGDSVTRGLNIGFHEDLTADEFRTVKASEPFPVQIRKGTVTIGSLPAISGTVTANNSVLSNVLDYDGNNYFLKIGGRTAGGKTDYPINVSGTVTIGSLPAISGTVTANNPSGALTTRFGSVTTANTAQITSAVTNTSRKYLLAQNISAETVTIGIGFSPTTTQGIQLTAGGGLTFDAFCPTGAVYWLGAVTGAAFTILEG